LIASCVKGLITSHAQDVAVTQYPNPAPAMPCTGQAIASDHLGGDLRGMAATLTTEFAVLLVRGSAVAILLSPALLAGFLLAG
jgi:hypothetical protein